MTLTSFADNRIEQFAPQKITVGKFNSRALWASSNDASPLCQEGNGMLSYRMFNDWLKKLCQKTGVREITPHGLRHSTSELYVEQGASREDIRRLLNHQNDKTTVRYMPRTDERLLRIASGVGAAEEKVGTSKSPDLTLVGTA